MSEDRVVRASSPSLLRVGAGVVLFGQHGEAYGLSGEHADLVSAVLDAAAVPIVREDLVVAILDSAGADLAQRPAVDDAIALLVRVGALVSPSAGEPSAEAPSVGGARVLVCCTGAIGALSTPALVDTLLGKGHDVRVAMTRSARRFVTRRAFEALTHREVATSLWQRTAERPAPHIELARWADVVVVYPCTATTVARLAAGDCSEIVSAVGMTTRAPVLLAPSMNQEMAQSCAVKGNLTRLCERGFYVAAPAMGNEVADAPRRRVKRAGVAPSPSQILRYVSWLLEREAKKDPRLLSSVEWEVEHERVRHANADPVDVDVMAALMAHASPPARVLDVGTGLGAVARAAAQEGFAVVATDFARRALERARSVDPKAPVTWIVDDATRTTLVSTFDVVIDRACLGCVPIAQRQIYAATLERLVNPGGVLILKAHAATGRPMRAYGFAREEVLSLFAPGFAAIAVRESTLDFGDIRAAPALHVELRRRP